MVIGFQLYPDNQPVTLTDGTGIWTATSGWNSGVNLTNAQGQIVYDPPLRSVTPTGGGAAVNYIDWSRIASLVVAVVALDVNSLNTATAQQITKLSQVFPLPTTTNGTTPLTLWAAQADALGSTGPTSVPLPLRQAVRVFQESFPITPYGTQKKSNLPQ
jgi:hypothetical protein